MQRQLSNIDEDLRLKGGTVITMEGATFLPAVIEGNSNVLQVPNFIMVKRSWQPDQEAVICPLCRSKFGGLKRRHHCRQCGLVVCNKCCNEKVPLPQLGIEELEKICESCLPVTSAVTKSRSHLQAMQQTAATDLAGMCKNADCIPKVFKHGGFHTLLAMAGENVRTPNMEIMRSVVGALHTLSMYEPVQNYMVSTGVITALCQVLQKVADNEEQILLDGISALTIYCKSQHFLRGVLSSGGLVGVLRLCTNPSDVVALMAVSALSLLLVDPATHGAVIDGDKAALQRLLKFVAADNPQMQAVALKCLNYLSMGSDWNKHRILQEDFTAGKPLLETLQTETLNMQVWANAACLVANLATSAEDQNCLVDCRDVLIQLLTSDVSNVDLLCNVVRGIANFSQFPQNANRMCSTLPQIVTKCLRHQNVRVQQYGLKTILNTLVAQTDETVTQLLTEGGAEVLKMLAQSKDITTAVFVTMDQQFPVLAKPL